MKRRTLSILLMIGMLSAFLSCGCAHEEAASETPAAVAGADSGTAPPDQELFDSVITESQDGRRRWILHSDRTERWLDVEDAELHEVHMDFFKADTLYSTLTSRRGRANLRNKNLFAWGEVVVTTRDGRRLETEELEFDNVTGLITNEVFNRFTRGDDVMTGEGMVATPDLDSFELKREVKAEIGSAAGEAGR